MFRRRTAVVAGLGLSALAGLTWLGIATADDPPRVPGTPGPPKATDAAQAIAQAVSAGRHVRIDGPRGPVHVWIPAGYHADTGATIVYVHGYFSSVDTAWSAHQLPQQFALSALNALFIVPEAPIMQRAPVNYPDLGELVRLVEHHTGVVRGAALTVALGHSGAYRTLQSWLDEPLLDQVVTVDAMYGEEAVFVDWLEASPHHRLISIGQDTILGTESLASKLPDTLLIDRIPPAHHAWPAEARTARHVYIRAQYKHMPLVTEGIVLPAVLRLAPVELLADQPWSLPLGSLPPLRDASVGAVDGPGG